MRPLEDIRVESRFTGILHSDRRVERARGFVRIKMPLQRNLVVNAVATNLRCSAGPFDSSIIRFIKPFSSRSCGTPAALFLMAKRKVRGDVIPSEASDQQIGQRELFEIDRSNLVLQLRALRRSINDGAEELKMVAIEGVFVNSLSRVLTSTARKLRILSEDFDGLIRQVERAAGPKATTRKLRTPKPRNRRSKRT